MAQITKRGKTYSIRVSAGYDINGKQLRHNYSWTPPPDLTKKQEEKELTRQAALFEERVRLGRVISANIKFADFSEIWLDDYAEKQLAPKTIHRYKDILKRVNQGIGHIRLDRLQPVHLIEFYDNLSERNIRNDQKYTATNNFILACKEKYSTADLVKLSGLSVSTIYAALRRKPVSESTAIALCKVVNKKMSDCFSETLSDSGLSPRTILHHHRVISTILSTAVHWQIIDSNPASRVKPPKVIKQESKFLDEDQSKRLIELLSDAPIQYRTMVILLIFTGLRRGEICGLKWSDLDQKNNILHVERALQYLPEKGLFIKEPKNTSSKRVIKLSN